jgi:Ner family transcriptional regulator
MDTDQTPAKPDWHPADVLAALKKRSKTLSGISTAHGYHSTAAGKALKQPWPAMEAVIAAAIGVPPEAIWPSRYAGSRPAASRPAAPRPAGPRRKPSPE